MKRGNQFDEVMIVNPSQNGTDSEQRVRLMRFHSIYPPELGGFAEPEAYGYYAEPEAYGYYGEVEPMAGYYGQVEPAFGYYGEVDPTVGYYGQVDPAYGYYAETPEYGAYEPMGEANAEPVGYFAEEYPMGYYGEGPGQPMGYYGHGPEMVGYGEPELAEEYPGMAYYGEPDYSGYVRESEVNFNPGCPLPTNVNGFEDGDFAGYSRPETVNPSCDQMTSQPGSAASTPDTFKPLW